MEESSPKRRRISPPTDDSSTRDAPPDTTPSRPRRKRPSFASPTKASLARHHAQILERRRSLSPTKSSPARPPMRRRASDAALEPATLQEVTPSEPAASDLGDAPDHEIAQDASELQELVRRPAPGMTAPPRRSPAKPNPRPLPRPGPDDEDENPFMGRTLRRSPVAGVSFPEPEEPELPPSVPDPVSSTPPRGIHSSPLRWREKKKPKKNSPLKAPPSRPRQGYELAEAMSRSLAGPFTNSQPEQTVETDESTHPARRVLKFDPNAEKKQERDALKEEIARLKRDLEVVRSENERIRLMQDSGRNLAANDEDQVANVVRKHLLPRDANAQPTSSQQLLEAALKPSSFLPFSKAGNFSSLVVPDVENYSDIKSHHPVPMAAEEELPYLQLFSPFTVTSKVAMLASAPGEPPRQRHSMSIRSRETPGLFAARIEMVVNAMNLTILELSVPALEPAAKAELQPFVDQICSGNCNRSMQRNVGILAWAMGEWYRVAAQRALLWSELEKELSSKRDLREKTKRVWKRKHVAAEEHDELSIDAPVVSCKRVHLLQFMGQQAFDLPLPFADGSTPTIRLEWQIHFDWSGEAQSSLSVKFGIPGKWRRADQRGALSKLPKLFEDVVGNGERPSDATRMIVALLAGEEAQNLAGRQTTQRTRG
ncbi:hypothetical protein B0I35DRAFT_65980 [Stachybotrys elegans]|uniref:Uncharacterized protein n=1 Tax=Stachybotrys elegans TaxID=80388 RepID=A0A8K0WPS6_9HYPO|nr:hypothetical protein B0I35DRAFT_65980 [Stachybotrys elegans]